MSSISYFISVCCMVLGMALGTFIGTSAGRKEVDTLKSEAIKRNAAHWKVDGASGRTEFEWNEVSK